MSVARPLLRNLTVREVIEALEKCDPDAFVVSRTPSPMYPDLVSPVQRVEELPGRDFDGYRNLSLVLESNFRPDFPGGVSVALAVLGDGPSRHNERG